MWGTLLVCAAGPLDTGQDISTYLFYLFLNFLPTFIVILLHLAYPTKALAMVIGKSAPWRLCTRVKRYKIPVRNHQAKDKTSGSTIRTYLFPVLFTTYKVGCRIEIFLRRFSGPPTWDHSHLAFESEATLQSASSPVRFDSDSYPIGVDSHALRCMANKAHLFEDLRLNKDRGQVDGISNGLAITGRALSTSISRTTEADSTLYASQTASTYLI
jgi:hypothetical protein